MPVFIPHTAGVGIPDRDKLNANLATLNRPNMTSSQRTRGGTAWQEGQLVYDTTVHKMYLRVAAGWQQITSV